MPQQQILEAHSLHSLSKRVLIGRVQLSELINSGRLPLMPGSHSRSLILTKAQCDELRALSVAKLSGHLASLDLTEGERRKIVATTEATLAAAVSVGAETVKL